MGIFAGLAFFYQKIIIPSLAFSVVMPLFFLRHSDFFPGAGVAFTILLPTMHYLTYEVRKPQEYYFYYNLGLSKLTLWITTVGMGAIIGLSLTVI